MSTGTASELRERLKQLYAEKNNKLKEYEMAGGPTEDQKVELEMLNEDIASIRKSLKATEDIPKYNARYTKCRTPRSRLDPEAIEAFDAHPLEDMFAEDIDAREKIKRVLASVPPRTPTQGEVFNAYFIEGLSLTDIGNRRGTTPSSTSRTLFKAKANIRGQSEIVLKALDARDADYSDMFVVDVRTSEATAFLHKVLSDAQYRVLWRYVVKREKMIYIAKKDGTATSTVSRVYKNARLRIYQCIPKGMPAVIVDLNGSATLLESPLPYRKYPYPARTEGSGGIKEWERITGYTLG